MPTELLFLSASIILQPASAASIEEPYLFKTEIASLLASGKFQVVIIAGFFEFSFIVGFPNDSEGSETPIKPVFKKISSSHK
jgi:hypothetical protein